MNSELNDFSWDEMNTELQGDEPKKEVPDNDPLEKKEEEQEAPPPEKDIPIDKPDESDAKILYEDFKNIGLIKHLEFEEGVEITQENLKELLEADREAEIEEQIKQYIDSLNPELKGLMLYVQNGGNVQEYITKTTTDFDLNGDIKNDNYQNAVIRQYEKGLGSTDEEINDLITLLETGDKKLSRATKYQTLLKQQRDTTEKQIVQEQELKVRKAEEVEKQFVANITNELKNQSILGLNLVQKDKDALNNYITNRTVAIEGMNGRVTEFQYKLQEALRDPAKLIFMAQLVRDDFKLDKLVKNYNTKQTQVFRTRVKQTKQEGVDVSDNPWSALNNQFN